MDKLHVTLAVALAFVVGCAAASAVVPPARAAAATRWEYVCYPSQHAGGVQQKLDALGKEGWELQTFGRNGSDDFFCLKRALP